MKKMLILRRILNPPQYSIGISNPYIHCCRLSIRNNNQNNQKYNIIKTLICS